jgi:Domain of unknown function (DUF4258)
MIDSQDNYDAPPVINMPDLELTSHLKDMLAERNILEEWVLSASNDPDEKKKGENDNIHYFKSIQERDGRLLHVVVNEKIRPNRVITTFFDRRLRKKR